MWQDRLAPYIESDTDSRDNDHEQPALPCRFRIVWVLDRYERLNQNGAQKETGGIAGLPAEGGKPATGIAQGLLEAWRSELRYPVILAFALSVCAPLDGRVVASNVPPAVGAIEAISASDAARNAYPTKVQT